MAATGIIPTVDFVVKRLFGTEEHRALLIHFLNSVLTPPAGDEIAEVEFLNPIRDKEVEEDKLVIVDIRVRDRNGRRFIIEMQVSVVKAFRERVLYYWARDYSDQLKSGTDYSLLTPTI